ncbi:unnamed protein product [Sympodiomycopsis kandeliae]
MFDSKRIPSSCPLHTPPSKRRPSAEQACLRSPKPPSRVSTSFGMMPLGSTCSKSEDEEPLYDEGHWRRRLFQCRQPDSWSTRRRTANASAAQFAQWRQSSREDRGMSEMADVFDDSDSSSSCDESSDSKYVVDGSLSSRQVGQPAEGVDDTDMEYIGALLRQSMVSSSDEGSHNLRCNDGSETCTASKKRSLDDPKTTEGGEEEPLEDGSEGEGVQSDRPKKVLRV